MANRIDREEEKRIAETLKRAAGRSHRGKKPSLGSVVEAWRTKMGLWNVGGNQGLTRAH